MLAPPVEHEKLERDAHAPGEPVEELPFLDEVAARWRLHDPRGVLGPRSGEPDPCGEVLQCLGRLGHAGRLERHARGDDVVGELARGRQFGVEGDHDPAVAMVEDLIMGHLQDLLSGWANSSMNSPATRL